MSTIVKDSGPGPARHPKANASWEDADAANEALEADFKPLSPEQAKAWRQRNPLSSPWRVLALQLLLGLGFAVLLGGVSAQFRLAASALWGTVAVLVPAVVFARALTRQMRQAQAGAALAGLFVWELVKVVLTVALLLVAPKVVPDLSWFALVAGFVVTMKVYWLAMALGWMRRKAQT